MQVNKTYIFTLFYLKLISFLKLTIPLKHAKMIRFVNGLWRFSYNICDCLQCLTGEFANCTINEPMFIETDYRKSKPRKKTQNDEEPTVESLPSHGTIGVEQMQNSDREQELNSEAMAQNSASLFSVSQCNSQPHDIFPGSTQQSGNLHSQPLFNPVTQDTLDEFPSIVLLGRN